MVTKLLGFLKNNFLSVGGMVACCMFSTIVSMPFEVPLPVTWGAMGLCALRAFYKRTGFSYINLLFIFWSLLSVVLAHPDPLFKSGLRLGNFVLLCMCVAPLIQGDRALRNKIQIFNTFITLGVVFSVGSFFAYFFGINNMHSNAVGEEMFNTAGVFGGLFFHSMLLGPIASVSALVCLYKFLMSKKHAYFVLTGLCVGSVMFAASRSAFIAMIAAGLVILYIVGRSQNKLLKYMSRCFLVLVLLTPLLTSGTRLLQQKQNANEESGGMFESRSEKFAARQYEISKSPLYGVGFAAIDIESGDEYMPDTGTIEPGSSWLCVMSMTGVVGFLLFCGIIITTVIRQLRSKSVSRALPLGLLTFFMAHFIAEGYVLAAGSALCFLAWVVIGFYDKSHDISVLTKEVDDL